MKYDVVLDLYYRHKLVISTLLSDVSQIFWTGVSAFKV